MSFPAAGSLGKLLNSKKAKHSDLLTDPDVDAFCAKASEVADAAQALALAVARLAEKGVRTVHKPTS